MVNESTLNLTVQVQGNSLHGTTQTRRYPLPLLQPFFLCSLLKFSRFSAPKCFPNSKTPTHFVDPSQFINDDVSTGTNGPGKKKKSRENPNSVRDKTEWKHAVNRGIHCTWTNPTGHCCSNLKTLKWNCRPPRETSSFDRHECSSSNRSTGGTCCSNKHTTTTKQTTRKMHYALRNNHKRQQQNNVSQPEKPPENNQHQPKTTTTTPPMCQTTPSSNRGHLLRTVHGGVHATRMGQQVGHDILQRQ